MSNRSSLLLRREDVANLLTTQECMQAVELAFRMLGDGKAAPPGVLGVHTEGGGFHIKAGILHLHATYFAAKVNANFPANPSRAGLPTIQGVIVLCDGTDGRMLALMDSIEITARRTAAATAVAAKYLARPDSTTVTICGCGQQGRAQLQALACTFRLAKACAHDSSSQRAAQFAEEMSETLNIPVEVCSDPGSAARRSDICVTCTPSRQPFLTLEDVAPGAFIAAVGADHPEKQELHAALMAQHQVVVDSLEQCAVMGDLHHAIASGQMTKKQVYAELGEIVAGKRRGRTSDKEVIIFDSTGIALQDVAAAAVVYEKAVQQNCGARMDFAA